MKRSLLPIAVCIIFSSHSLSQNTDTLWSENWEGDWIENWYVDAGTWEVGDATSGPDTAHEGSMCAATVLAGNYMEEVDSRLVRFRKFVVPPANQNPRLRFWGWFNFYNATTDYSSNTNSDYGYVQIKTEHGNWQNISVKQLGTSSNSWSYSSIDLSRFADSLVQIAFYFHSHNLGGYTEVSSGWYIDEVQLISGNYLFDSKEGFENGYGDWSVSSGTWNVGSPTSGPKSAYSGENCAGTSLYGNYSEFAASSFVSPPFRVKPASESPSLRFWHWYSFSEDDYGEVYIKTENREWEIISNRFVETSSNVWTTFYADLSPYADSVVQIYFYFKGLNPGGYAEVSSGWYIDEFNIGGVPLHDKIIVENDLAVRWVDPVGKPLCGTSGEQPVTVRVKNEGEYAVSNFEVGYSIDNGLNYINETVFQSLAPGDSLEYKFRRRADMLGKDIYNCRATVRVPYDINDANDVAVTTVENNRLICDISTTDTKCNEATGIAEVLNISGRQQPYELNWSTGDTDMKAEKLEAGVYFITITDANGCTSVKSFTINDQGAPELSMDTKVNNISCFGMTDGSIDIAPIGGTQPYGFRWSEGSTGEDINDLSKGHYDVTVTDANGCAKNHSFYIEEPAPLKIKATSTDASCGELNGWSEIIAGGGTPPYSFTWNAKPVSTTVTGLGGGLYTAQVTDSKGCIDFTTVSVSEIDAPQIVVTSVTPASCNQNDGGINVSMADPGIQYDYLWSDGSATQDIQNVPSGVYSITVSNKDGYCSASQVIEIPSRNPSPGEICMISVDSVTNKNVIVLKDPEMGEGIVSTKVYLLGKTGSYQLMNSIDQRLTNTVVDEGSNSEITSYMYRITRVDGCGNESESSDFHETMHVVATPDLNLKRANIFWNSYKGADYDFFQVYRYAKVSGFEIIDTVPKIINKEFYTYTDLNPPLDDTIYYVIAIEMSESCNSYKKSGSHNTLRSNKTKNIEVKKSNASGIPVFSTSLSIYPNPNRGTFYIDLGTIAYQDIVIRIFDSQGRSIRNWTVVNNGRNEPEKIELPDIEPGIYLLHLQLPGKTMSRAMLIE